MANSRMMIIEVFDVWGSWEGFPETAINLGAAVQLMVASKPAENIKHLTETARLIEKHNKS